MEKNYDLICIGMALVDSIIKGFDPIPVSASGYRAVSGSIQVGGEAVNEAIAASKLGMKTAILCSLGLDEAGNMIADALEKYDVDTSLMYRTGEHATPVTTMFVREDGTRKSITNQSHTYNFHPEREEERFSQARAVILGSLFRAPFDDPEIIHTVVKRAKDAGELIFADTKLPNFHVLKLTDLSDSLPMIDYITPNEDEARYYSGMDLPEDMADVFLKMGIRNVIIKLGSKGCFMKNAEHTHYLPAYQIRALDATGAGDNFIAGVASEILRGKSQADALAFANACGAICTTGIGAASALKNRDQVLSFMENTSSVGSCSQ